MKKILIAAAVSIACCGARLNAQNIFPATGSAGIGTTSPQNRLHVETSGFNEGILTRHAPNGKWSLLSGGSLGGGSWNGISQAGDGAIIFGGNNINTASGFVIAPWRNAAAGLRMNGSGQVSLYTAQALESLEMNHANGFWTKTFAGSLTPGGYNGLSQQDDAGIIFGGAQPGTGPAFVIAPWANATSGLRIQNSGAVQVGHVSTPAGYKLYVEQGILTEKVKVAVKSSADWADHVFNKNYPLMPLEQVEAFVTANGHLPHVPSAGELVNEGIDLGKMDAKLMEKIEELTLYSIQLKKEINRLQEKISALEKNTSTKNP